MSKKENKKSLDELISRAVSRENLKFDFNKWQAKHQNQIQEFQTQVKHPRSKTPVLINIWRIIMKNRLTKLTAAAAIIIAVFLSLNVFDKSIATVYAIEQTIQASHSVQYLHLKAIAPSHEDQPIEAWLEFSQDGQPKNMRLNLPDWMAPGGGPREVIWYGNKKQEWLKEKNILTTVEDEADPAQILKMMEYLDPKLAVVRLQEKQQQGKVEIEISEPADKAEPIVITATSTKEDDSSFQRKVLFVDQATRLVNAIELYKLKDGKYELLRTVEYYDYNQPIDSGMFTFDNLSEDVERIDSSVVGLEQGKLSDKEVAVKIVQELFKSLIAKDYTKVGRLHGGASGAEAKKVYAAFNVVRVISIGEPLSQSGTRDMRVPFTIEIEENGQIKQVQDMILVRPTAERPGYWEIH